MNNRLVAHWPLNEDTGDALDWSGNENHGTVNGATQGISGLLQETAYSFDGTNDKINIGNADKSLKTISFWLNSDNTMDGAGNFTSHIGLNSGEFIGKCFGFNNISKRAIGINGGPTDAETSVDSSISYASNTWHYFTFRWNGSQYEIYHNAEKQPTESGSGGHAPLVTDQSALSFGYRRSNSDGYYSGEMFDVRFYNRTLTQSEIRYLYETGKTAQFTTEYKELS